MDLYIYLFYLFLFFKSPFCKFNFFFKPKEIKKSALGKKALGTDNPMCIIRIAISFNANGIINIYLYTLYCDSACVVSPFARPILVFSILACCVRCLILIYFEGVHKLHISITCLCYIKSVDPISISYACVYVSRAMYKLRVHQNYIREFNIGTELQFTVRVGALRCRRRPL